MKENRKNNIHNLTLSAIFVALASVLSLIKVYELPLGGSITLLSMLPIVMVSCMLGVKWGFIASFTFSLVQLGLGIAGGLFGWGLTPAALIGAIFLDYIVPFTALGIAGIVSKKGMPYILAGTTLALCLRFLSHLLSGAIIFDIWCEWENVWFYSLCYNGSYMLPELVLTLVGVALIFKLPQIKKLTNKE